MTQFACSNGAKPLTEEQRELRCQNLFTEYLSTTDIDEAVLTAQEIVTPGSHLHQSNIEISMKCMLLCTAAHAEL